MRARAKFLLVLLVLVLVLDYEEEEEDEDEEEGMRKKISNSPDPIRPPFSLWAYEGPKIGPPTTKEIL